jgi:hypothetical protein
MGDVAFGVGIYALSPNVGVWEKVVHLALCDKKG